MNAQYANFPIASIESFTALWKEHPNLEGLNVTIPYKKEVIAFRKKAKSETAFYDILDKIASNSEYFSFETPLNHPKMNISVHETYQKLAKYFKTVMLLNIYDAYSSGYRANFVCYS